MATTFDRKKPFGTIYNDDQGRMYEQDGNFFRGDGSLWTDPEAADAPKPATGKKTASKPAAGESPAADDQINAQLGDA